MASSNFLFLYSWLPSFLSSSASFCRGFLGSSGAFSSCAFATAALCKGTFGTPGVGDDAAEDAGDEAGGGLPGASAADPREPPPPAPAPAASSGSASLTSIPDAAANTSNILGSSWMLCMSMRWEIPLPPPPAPMEATMSTFFMSASSDKYSLSFGFLSARTAIFARSTFVKSEPMPPSIGAAPPPPAGPLGKPYFASIAFCKPSRIAGSSGANLSPAL
mmetsp:Transcript_150366/g.483239  ORF Transcript_150366/g.483239 Transcript_150366/m.483239 type:complete len:219 (+) Transcript_150366:1149-1805(+)